MHSGPCSHSLQLHSESASGSETQSVLRSHQTGRAGRETDRLERIPNCGPELETSCHAEDRHCQRTRRKKRGRGNAENSHCRKPEAGHDLPSECSCLSSAARGNGFCRTDCPGTLRSERIRSGRRRNRSTRPPENPAGEKFTGSRRTDRVPVCRSRITGTQNP